MKFYVAYAIRHVVSSDDINFKVSYSSFKEASKVANSLLIDDDDSGVFTKHNGKWYQVWEQTKNGFLVSEEPKGYNQSREIRIRKR